MLPWSVTARLSMPSFLTWLTSSGMRLAPSSSEYSLWVWRWANDISVASHGQHLAIVSFRAFTVGANRRCAGVGRAVEICGCRGRLYSDTERKYRQVNRL